jgi:hypothetical protein
MRITMPMLTGGLEITICLQEFTCDERTIIRNVKELASAVGKLNMKKPVNLTI